MVCLPLGPDLYLLKSFAIEGGSGTHIFRHAQLLNFGYARCFLFALRLASPIQYLLGLAHFATAIACNDAISPLLFDNFLLTGYCF